MRPNSQKVDIIAIMKYIPTTTSVGFLIFLTDLYKNIKRVKRAERLGKETTNTSLYSDSLILQL